MQKSLAPQEPTEAEKVEFLSRQEVWPHAPESVEVVETHMSWVFLAGERVYKLKKPIQTAFLDFSTFEHREYAVAEELRLNRRLAPDVYLGARSLRVGHDGGLTLDGFGRVVEWLVEMRRLPEAHSLSTLIDEGTATLADLAAIADVFAAFYRGLPPADTTPARYVERFAREQAETRRVLTDPALAFEEQGLVQVLEHFEMEFVDVLPLLEARVRADRIVEGHGDLRPEHVFLTRPPVVIDCLEFNKALRTVDPFDEIAFLGLECALLGAEWVFPELRKRLETALKDRPDPKVVTFYWRYRALLRARLALLHLSEPFPRDPGKWRPLARRYLEFAVEAEIRCAPQ